MLPPYSWLTLSRLADHHDEGKASATYGSLPNPHTFSNWDNSSPFGSLSSYAPPSTHLPPYGSGKSTRLASLAPISTSDIHQQHHTSSVRLSPEPQPAGMHHHQARRLPSMQLVSPTGGPLHPLPSGLVGFPPLASPQSLDRISHPPSPAFRPRSNSVTTHPYAGPYFSAGRNERSNSINGERRTSVGWHSHETSNTRKRRQEASEPTTDRYSRPRTASLSSTEESRPVSAWAAGPDRLGLPGRGGGSGSTHSSPVESQGPYRGSFDSLGGARRGSGDSGRSVVERSDTSPRMRGHPTAEYHRPASQLAPDLASLHITRAEAWRNIAAPAPFPGSRAPSSIHAPAATPVAAASLPHPRTPWPSGAAALASAAAAAQAHAAQPSGVDDAGESAAEAGRYKCPHCSESASMIPWLWKDTLTLASPRFSETLCPPVVAEDPHPLPHRRETLRVRDLPSWILCTGRPPPSAALAVVRR